MTVSIIIVNFNGFTYTKQCLESLFRYHKPDSFEVIVVDNNSTDGSPTLLRQLFPSVRLIELTENKGFGTANNVGASAAIYDVLFFLNNDTLIVENVLDQLTAAMSSNRSCGIVGPKLLNDDKTLQVSFGKFPTVATEWETKNATVDAPIQETSVGQASVTSRKDWLTGAAMLVSRKIFIDVGGFDQRFFMYFEDIDLCKRVMDSGFEIHYVPSVKLIHLGGKSYGRNVDHISVEYRRSQLLYYDKHNSLVQQIAVRLYLFCKYGVRLLTSQQRKRSMKILSFVFKWQH